MKYPGIRTVANDDNRIAVIDKYPFYDGANGICDALIVWSIVYLSARFEVKSIDVGKSRAVFGHSKEISDIYDSSCCGELIEFVLLLIVIRV